jgi:hypothetical protein
MNGLAQDVAEPYRQQTEDQRKDGVGRRIKPLAFAREIEGLETERREGRVAAQDTSHDELSGRRMDEQSPFWIRQRGDKPDEKRSGDVDRQRSNWKRFAETSGDHAGEPVSADATERAAQRDPKIFHFQSPLL